MLMPAGAELGPGMPVMPQTSALVVCQSSACLLPALFRFFLEGNTDLSIAWKPYP